MSEEAQIVQSIIGLPMRLKAHRSALGLSLREVATRCGVSAATLSRVESGKDYSVGSLIGIATYLDAEQ